MKANEKILAFTIPFLAIMLLISLQNVKAQTLSIDGVSETCYGNTEEYNINITTNIVKTTWLIEGNPNNSASFLEQDNESVSIEFEDPSTYTLSVSVRLTNGQILSSSKIIIVRSTPVTAGPIIGNSNVSKVTFGVIYSIPPVQDATEYIWTLPNGANFQSTQNTNSIIVNYSQTAVSGNISVAAKNICGEGELSILPITVNPQIIIGPITGNSAICANTSGVVYTAPTVSGITSYSWSVPSGASIVSGQGTSRITVNYSTLATSGTISVFGLYTSGGNTAPASLAITVGALAIAGSITGPNIVKPNTSGVSYSIGGITGATGYNWELPNGATIASGANTNSILVNYPSAAASGIIRVTPVNGCGSGIPSNITVTVGDVSTAGSITINPIDASNNFLKFKTSTTNVGIIGTDASINSGGSATNIGMAVFGNNSLEFSTNNVKRLVVNGSGNIGIGLGTASPTAKLDVAGDINVSAGSSFKVAGVALTGSQWISDNNCISYNAGNVGIGTTDTKGYKLAVNGRVVAEEVIIKLYTLWPDFIFNANKKLRSLNELEQFIKTNNHLPEIPTETEVKENGISVGEMNSKLLQKIEELTLYVIEQNKRIEALENEIKKPVNK